MTATGISQGEPAGWQRRAAAELGRILAARPGLPCINWTAGPAGSVVVGQVSGLAPAGQVRPVFQAWRLARAGRVPRAAHEQRDGVAARGSPAARGQGPADRDRVPQHDGED